MPVSESLSTDTLLVGCISEVTPGAAAGAAGGGPEAELRLEKLAWEDGLEALDLPAESGRPACINTLPRMQGLALLSRDITT